ncbi:MAG: RNA polymerase sigma factor [Acidimicrobiales bacterium]
MDDLRKEETFRAFVLLVEPRLRRSLVARYGYERGSEATCEALAYAWERWDRLLQVDNKLRYLYRVGQSRTRARRRRSLFGAPAIDGHAVEPRLPRAMEDLSGRQRAAVLLVIGDEWTCREVGELLGLSTSTVQRHLERGLAKLRHAIEGGDRSGPRGESQARAEPTS